MEKPKVTVIMPCYNAQATVGRALDSLYGQTLKDLEVICINDGSRDLTLSYLNQYRWDHPDMNLRIFTQSNMGVAEARNLGVSKAEGIYIGFLDSDDTAEPEMFEDLYNIAEEQQLQVAVSNFWWVNSKGKRRLQKEGPYETGCDMMVRLFSVLWNKIYRTDFIRNLDIRFPKGDRYEDSCFLYCLVMHVKKIGFVNKAYVHYYQHPSSITHTSNEQVRNMIDVFQIILQYYKDHGTYDQYKDALEYLHIKFFLGNNFLRGVRIDDPKDREETIRMGWDLLNKEFPGWKKNPYLKSLGGMKNKYYSMVTEKNLKFFTWFFRTFGKDNI